MIFVLVQLENAQAKYGKLRTRVKTPVNLLEPLRIDVRIDLGGRDIGVTEHFLHLTQIRSTRQQVCGEAVAERVRTDTSRGTRSPRILFDQFPNRFSPQTTSAS